MRKLKQLALFLTVVLLLTSCSKDDDNSSGGDEFLTAKIDATDFAASQSPAVIVGAQSTNGILAVQGGDNNGNTINMAIQNYSGVGTYKTGDNLTNGNMIQYLQINPLSTWASNLATAAVGTLQAGSIEITSDDGTTVEGTFSFEGYNASDMTTKVVTQGSFKALFD
jgi:hypothetical protein